MKNIFLSTGGTGGHIIPAVIVAKALKETGFNAIVVGDSGCSDKYFKNTNIEHINIRTGKKFTSIKGLYNIILGFFQSIFLITKYKPEAIIGFGSYATFPLLAAALLFRKRIVLHEQNAYMGKVNKVFGKYAKVIMTAYNEIYGIRFEDSKKIKMVGNPVKREIVELHNKKYKYPEGNEKIHIFIVGGSGGANFLSHKLILAFENLTKEEKKRIKITQQCREEDLDFVRSFYEEKGIETITSPFFTNIPEILSSCQLVISRAGASATAEFAMAGIPMILLPLSVRGNNRQIVNAEFFAKNSSAILVEEKDFDPKKFKTMLFELIENRKKLEDMSNKAKEKAILNAENDIVSVIKEVVNN